MFFLNELLYALFQILFLESFQLLHIGVSGPAAIDILMYYHNLGI